MAEKCRGTLPSPGGWAFSPCSRQGKFFEGGKWWCFQHAPSKVEEKQQERMVKDNQRQEEHTAGYAKLAYDRAAGDLCRSLGLDKDGLTVAGLVAAAKGE